MATENTPHAWAQRTDDTRGYIDYTRDYVEQTTHVSTEDTDVSTENRWHT